MQAIAFIGTYLPRQCGIATFTADLVESVATESPSTQCFAVAVNDTPEGYRYPDRVRFEIQQNDVHRYRQAADFLNISHVDVVCLQHEYGIFGGPAGSHILTLLRDLSIPVVTTLHTVLDKPSSVEHKVMIELAQISDRLVVMSKRAKNILTSIYAVPKEKVDIIHHGIPDVSFVDPNYYKDNFGAEGKNVILTFGLLSPGKGIEYMLEALPCVVEKFPNTVYIVLGATHPHELRTSGEAYRISLQRRARELDVASHVMFHNRFVDIEELCEFIGAADIYVTPYLNPFQIVSGTLAYTLGAGKAIISTPYWYAQDMLADERGRLVPFRDTTAMANQVVELLDNDVERHAMRKRAYTYGRQMTWPTVANNYLKSFELARDLRARRPRPVFVDKTVEAQNIESPAPNLAHLVRLTDDTGLFQHAVFTMPAYREGYCTDDNARALALVSMLELTSMDTKALRNLAARYLSFLDFALDRTNDCFRNVLSYDRQWIANADWQDCHGRALWGLGTAVAYTGEEGIRAAAMNLFEDAVRAVSKLTGPRAWAFALVGIHEYLRRFEGDTEARRSRAVLAEKLFNLYKTNACEEWPWFENSLGYANAKLSHALILSGQWMQRGDMMEAGLTSLDWLMKIQTSPRGHFSAVGSNGFYTRGGEMARFDQQPIEAHAMVSACLEAHRVTGDVRWRENARRAFEWFLGANDLQLPLYDFKTGGCHDGLHPDRVNGNEGAESTVAWLFALVEIRLSESAVEEKSL